MTTSDLDMLEQCIKTSLPPGGCVIFQVPEDQIKAADKAIQGIMPILKARNICAILFNEDVTVIMVPEARRVIPIAGYK